ncbi:MAG: DNA alkylation repair protein [Candidatus ainarchaeum sp.]|nr:DNA alkylation repair protein [Candidatus ainarchaeum sp.]
MDVIKIKKEIDSFYDSEKSLNSQRFFKTGKGEYGEGDVFLGLSVPLQRSIAKKYFKEINIKDLDTLIKSKIHEHRQVALFLMVYRYEIEDKKGRDEIYNYYVKNIDRVNNWDLVDSSAPNIIGQYLYENPSKREVLYKWVKSEKLFVRRIAIISTFYFIKKNYFLDSLKLSKLLLKDKEDLIHKAVGWMLREIGKRDLKEETNFLDKYFKEMPRTMLRYSIEKFEEKERLKYLKG